MKLQKISIMIFISLLALFLFFVSSFFSTIILSSYQNLEEKYLENQLEEVVNKINDDFFSLSCTVSDWGYWNDTVDFVKGNNPDYIFDNLEEDTFDNLYLNLMVFTNKDGEIIYSGSYDLQKKVMIEVPSLFTKKLDLQNPLMNISESGKKVHGFVLLPESPLMVVSQPIMYSDLSGDVEGIVIFGKYLNQQEIARLGILTKSNLSFYKTEDISLPRDMISDITKNSNKGRGFIKPVNPEIISAYYSFQDIFGVDALILQVTRTRDIFHQGIDTTIKVIGIILIGGLLLGLTFIFMLNQKILKRISSIAFQVHEIGRAGSSSDLVKISGDDELSGLASEINRMLKTINQTQTKLIDSEQQFRDLVESIPDYIIVYDENDEVLYINPAAANVIGHDAESMIGKPVYQLVGHEYHEIIKARLNARQRGDIVPPYEIEIVTGEGITRTVIIKGRNVTYNSNPAIFLLLIDITERKEYETEREHYAQELLRYSTSLKQANRQVNLLSSITRHDILNEVNIGLLYLDILEMNCQDPIFKEKLQEIDSVIKSIQKQIEFTRIYEGLGIHEPIWQSLQKVVSHLHPPETITIHSDTDDFVIFADQMFEKVFFNLLDNSIRHGEHVSDIHIYAREDDGLLFIYFEDNGTGVPSDEKELIFKRGFGKNTGFGMFLVREILSLTGISIRETGTHNIGARFEIVVPKGSNRKEEK